MSEALPSYEDLEPKSIWADFAAMCSVPRPSKKEERIVAHLTDLCRSRGFETAHDEVGNLIVKVPGSAGSEQAPTVILQAHVDMVCEKNTGTSHDFDRDPIRYLVDRDPEGNLIVRADGTTLGADNGIGVCMALAAASEDIAHPPLELLLTVDEEAGMTGAENLDGSLLQGRRLLNLDTEADATLYVGCAGGCDSNMTLTLAGERTRATVHRLVVDGLRGGHSGADIHEGRGCANRLLARVLDLAGDVRLAAVGGGSKRNAIAREAWALVQGDAETLEQAARQVQSEGRVESKEPDLRVRVERQAESGDLLLADESESRRLVRLLLGLPHGVVGMHPDIPELVETSNNLATVDSSPTADGLEVSIGTLSRSSSASRMEEVLRQIESVARLAGARVSRANAYPGWQPDMDSPLLALCRRVHEQVFGFPPTAEAVHAGLECGLLGNRIDDLDMISLGPRIEGAHSPDERVWVQSVQDSWTYLKALLAELATDR